MFIYLHNIDTYRGPNVEQGDRAGPNIDHPVQQVANKCYPNHALLISIMYYILNGVIMCMKNNKTHRVSVKELIIFSF